MSDTDATFMCNSWDGFDLYCEQAAGHLGVHWAFVSGAIYPWPNKGLAS